MTQSDLHPPPSPDQILVMVQALLWFTLIEWLGHSPSSPPSPGFVLQPAPGWTSTIRAALVLFRRRFGDGQAAAVPFMSAAAGPCLPPTQSFEVQSEAAPPRFTSTSETAGLL